MKRLLITVASVIGIATLTLAAGALLTRTDSHPTIASETQHAGHGTGAAVGLAPTPVTNAPPTAAKLAIAVRPAAVAEQGYTVEVRATQPDGKPAAELPVKFFELVELFGQREMLLGTATTDGRGIATYLYLPARTGQHPMVVRSAGRDRTLTAGEGRATFEAHVAAAPYEPIRSRLATFSDKVPYAAGVVVLGVWSLIAFALLGTARGVIGGARKTSQ